MLEFDVLMVNLEVLKNHTVQGVIVHSESVSLTAAPRIGHPRQSPGLDFYVSMRVLSARSANEPMLGRMTILLDLPDEAKARLEAEAARRGTSVDVLVTEFAEQLPRQQSRVPRRLSIIGIGASGEGTSHRIDELLADGFGRD